MAQILSGIETAKCIDEKNALKAMKLRAAGKIPTLAVVRVGARPDDLSYERGIIKKADKVNVDVKIIEIPDDNVSEASVKLEESIIGLNNDENIHGILLFRPLPKEYDEQKYVDLIAPEKDVDGITEKSMVGVYSGNGEGYPPCTPQACVEIMDHYNIDPKGKNIVVVGRSLVVGKPLAMMLIKRNATVTVCHTRTVDLPGICKKAEILIAAAGKAGMITKDYVSEGQTIIDVGINFNEEGKLCGDVAFDEAEPVVDAITPVPRGVGSVTTSVLLGHVIEACGK